MLLKHELLIFSRNCFSREFCRPKFRVTTRISGNPTHHYTMYYTTNARAFIREEQRLTGLGGKSGSKSELCRNNCVELFLKSWLSEPSQALSASLESCDGVAKSRVIFDPLDIWSMLFTLRITLLANAGNNVNKQLI